jgi:hypothetical protein
MQHDPMFNNPEEYQPAPREDRIDQLVLELASLLGVGVESVLVKVHTPRPESELTKWARQQSKDSILGYFDQAGEDAGIGDLVDLSHGAAVVSGWYNDAHTGLPVQHDPAVRVALIHSEISEALEGWRKDLPDSKLPEFSNLEVELADALHRIFDMAGELGLRLGEAYVAKGKYNLVRQDHTPEARRGKHGKRI